MGTPADEEPLSDVLADFVAWGFAKPSADRRGANEREVGVLFFDDSQTSAAVLELLPAVHRAFVERLRAAG